MSQDTFFARLAVCLALAVPASLFAAGTTDLPVVKTADLSGLLQGATPPETNGTPGLVAASVNADQVKWSGEEGKEMARIAALTPIDLSMNGGKGQDLRSALRAVCDAAGMHYYIRDDSVMLEPVTLSGNRHPWEYLRLLASMYNLEIVYRNGFWNIYSKNSSEFVMKLYVLQYNTLEKFKAAGGGSSLGGGGGSGASGEGAATGSGTASSGMTGSASVDRSGQSVFNADSEVIVKKVQQFLGVDSDVRFAAADGSLGMAGPNPSVVKDAKAKTGIATFDSDTNTLSVIATRAQHEALATWLAAMDKPIKELYIETKFLMTTVNPQSHIGVTNPLFSEGGIGGTLSGLQSDVSPFTPSTWKFPSAILTADDLSAKLSFMKSAADTSTVQYPQQVTLSGREVVLRSVRQVPIISNNAQTTTGSAIQNNSQVAFVDVGTVVSILPKVLNEKDILLNISIQVSTITGYQVLAGNSYPIIANQTYTNQVIVESGYSLALGGLEQTLATTNTTKIPLLGDIPFFGFPFKDTTRTDSRSVLTMVVTPVILPGYNGGNTSGRPQYTMPSKGTPARVRFAGNGNNTAEDVALSLRGFSSEVEELAQVAKEGRGDRRWRVRGELLLNELRLMEATIERERVTGRAAPTLASNIANYRKRLQVILKTIPDTSALS